MPSIFQGELTGEGVQHISDGGVVPTDADVWVKVIGPQVVTRGAVGHRLLKFAGWLQFFNSTYIPDTTGPPEHCSEPLYFNHETADEPIKMAPGTSATDFYYYVHPLTTVWVNISIP